MLNNINNTEPESKLGKIVRKILRKEWSYFFDGLIKVFTEKISNFDVITQVVQEITYGVLYNHLHNLGETILNEIGFKLGNNVSRPRNFYFAKFIMLLTKHVAPEMVINHPENKLICWVQNKRLFKDLVRINLHEGTELRLPQVIHVFLSTNTYTLNALPSSVAM